MNYPTLRASNEIDAWEEDLPWLAARSVELGREFCTCSAFYHELRGALRASGFIRDFESGQQILASTISPLLKNHSRVLIAGAADTGIFSTVMRVSNNKFVEVGVVDKCRAPLALIEEFAEVKGASCATIHSDIGALKSSEEWDLVILHYTSMFFDRHDRKRCFQRLAQSLAPGGILLCMDRLVRPPTGNELNEREIVWFREARRHLRNSSFGSFWESAELDNMLREFVRERAARGANYLAPREIEDIIANAGLRIVSRGDGAAQAAVKEEITNKADAHVVSVVLAVRDD